MANVANLGLYILVGLVGGFIGQKLKIPAGSMIGALLAVIAVKIILKSEWALPKNVVFLLQVAIGIMVGTTFQSSMLPIFYKIAIPVDKVNLIPCGEQVLELGVFIVIDLMNIRSYPIFYAVAPKYGAFGRYQI